MKFRINYWFPQNYFIYYPFTKIGKKIFFIFLLTFSLFLLAILESFGQTKSDSFSEISEKPDTSVIFHHFDLARYHLDSLNLDSVEYHVKEALQYLPSPDLRRIEFLLHSFLGEVYKQKSQHRLSFREFKICKKLAEGEEKIKNDEIMYIYLNLGNACYYLGKYTEAAENYFDLLKLARKTNDKNNISIAFLNLGNIYSIQGNYDLAIKYQKEALELHEAMEDTSSIAISFSNLANVYTLLERFDSALVFQYKSLSIREDLLKTSRIINEQDSFNILIPISHNYNNIGAIYGRQNKQDSAKIYYLKALKLREKFGYQNGIAESNHNLGTNLLAIGKYEEAKSYLEKAIEANDGNIELLANSYGDLAYVYEGLGLYKKAFENDEIYIKLRDSILNEDIRNQTLVLDVLEKDGEIDRQKTENLLKKLELEKEQKRSTIFQFMVYALLILAIIIIYFYFRLHRVKMIIEDLAYDLKHNLGGNAFSRFGYNIDSIIHSDNIKSELIHLKRQAFSQANLLTLLYSNAKELRTKNIRNFIFSLLEELEFQKPPNSTTEKHISVPSQKVYFEEVRLIGLIINEFVTNTFKYAHPESENPHYEFTINLVKEENNFIFLIKDNGVGLPEKNQKGINSLGLNLMKSHTAKLKGTPKLYNENGLVFRIDNLKLRTPMIW